TPVSSRLPTDWDGLTRVDSKKFEAVYLMPGANFSAYTKVMLGPTEVAFQKDWLSNYNQNAPFEAQMSNADAQKLLNRVKTGFEEVFQKAYAKGGYPVV